MQKDNRLMSFVIEAEQSYNQDKEHIEQVTMLALALFDELRLLHRYGMEERLLLEIAVRLHDIGWSRTDSGNHHKLSRDMILELPIPGLDQRQRLICALIARYHNKSLPNVSRHRQFASLDDEGRSLVKWLAGILRVADGLDCTHARMIKRIKCKVTADSIEIILESAGNCTMELNKACEKGALLIQTTGRKITYRY